MSLNIGDKAPQFELLKLLSTKYNKSKERVVVVLEDVENYDIGFGGESVEAIKAKASK
ncbi:tautomerase family protein [Campylobacter jejuni]|nr:tautomerase family protein [Campylobacter jejuni]